jgi:hypothetical protein
MGPEIWVALLAVFVSGGAVGTAGTLLTQWLLGRVQDERRPGTRRDVMEMDGLRAELSEIGRQVRNLDARLDFTEQLLDGALTLQPAPPHARAPGSDPAGPHVMAGEAQPGTAAD